MNIILLEKIRNLGNIGDQVKVKRGYWRNYLLPQSKAIMATQENLSKLTKMRAELETKANAVLQAAKDRASKLTNLILTIPVKTSEEGKLFGSVNIREIAQAAEKQGVELNKKEISLPQGPIHQIGDYDVHVHLHSDVNTLIKVKVIPATE